MSNLHKRVGSVGGAALPRKQKRQRLAEELSGLPDEAIDYSDIPELDEDFWQNAELVMPDGKARITLRLDRDVLEFFRRGGPGYQTRINAVLRAYVSARRRTTNP
jgi:uncharacterized protein (DUF4415 family)